MHFFRQKRNNFHNFLSEDNFVVVRVHIFTTFWYSRLSSKPSPIEARKDPVGYHLTPLDTFLSLPVLSQARSSCVNASFITFFSKKSIIYNKLAFQYSFIIDRDFAHIFSLKLNISNFFRF